MLYTHKHNCIHFHVVDRSRVLLKTMEDSTDEYVNTAAGAGYINASFVDVSDGGIEESYCDLLVRVPGRDTVAVMPSLSPRLP